MYGTLFLNIFSQKCNKLWTKLWQKFCFDQPLLFDDYKTTISTKVSIPTIPYNTLLCTHWQHENVVIYTIQVMYLNCIQRTIMDIIVDTSRCNDLTVLIQEKIPNWCFFWWQYQGHGTSCFKHFIFPSPIPISQNSLRGFWPPRPHPKAKEGISYERPQKIVWGSLHQ